ncbi:MAG: hypothetical protein ABIQ93_08290, partial [Saprospiraceae bacterium]
MKILKYILCFFYIFNLPHYTFSQGCTGNVLQLKNLTNTQIVGNSIQGIGQGCFEGVPVLTTGQNGGFCVQVNSLQFSKII